MDEKELIYIAEKRLERQMGDYPNPQNIELSQTAALIAIARSLQAIREHLEIVAERHEIMEIWK